VAHGNGLVERWKGGWVVGEKGLGGTQFISHFRVLSD